MTVFNVPRLCLAICIVQLAFVDFSCYDINSGVYRKEEKRIKKKSVDCWRWSRLYASACKSWKVNVPFLFRLSRLESMVMILICRKHFNRSRWLDENETENRIERAIQCVPDSEDWQLTDQTCCSRSMRKQAPRIFLPTITRDKNSFAFQSREPALGPGEKNLRIREYSLPSNSNSTPLRYFLPSPILLP